jgi:predicted alpha/beta superfamily hydrolase
LPCREDLLSCREAPSSYRTDLSSRRAILPSRRAALSPRLGRLCTRRLRRGTRSRHVPVMSEPPLSANPSRTVVRVRYPEERGSLGLRGDDPLSWDETRAPTCRSGDHWMFEFDVPEHELVELKLVRDEDDWQTGRNYVAHAGDQLDIEPYFDREEPELLDPATLGAAEDPLEYRVLLPPSYDEQTSKRYGVLYVLDGQSLWSSSEDPFGVWHLDTTLGALFELHAIEDVIVVGIDTGEQRVLRLTPVKDVDGEGGDASGFLARIANELVPVIDREFRTKPTRRDRGVMGSSLGGLFSFYSAWTRPDVFGKAACLSSSFWWADRFMIRKATRGACPSPLPSVYLDSGAAKNPHEDDPSLRDGFHHTRSMYRVLLKRGYTPGSNLHRLTFAGESHNAAAWAARVALPLQLLFPPVVST